MSGYLVAKEGHLEGMTIAFEEGINDQQWLLGRDPEEVDVVLEDPMVSRQHVLIRHTPEGLQLENLSTVNPAARNGDAITKPILLEEGSLIQIGSTLFLFTENLPISEEPQTPEAAETHPSSELHFGLDPDTRWLLKVISGPNSGAEFAMKKGETFLLGKDPNICDVVFQDLSVSRQHARLSIDSDENAFIEDLHSRNGVLVNAERIDGKQPLSSQDLVALGTTSFLVIDRTEPRETIVSPALEMPNSLKEKPSQLPPTIEAHKDWKELIIPKKHLAIAAAFGGVLLVSLFSMLSLFRAETVVVKKIDEVQSTQELLSKFEGVTFSLNPPSGKLFLTGHVLTTVEYQEMLYLLGEVPFIQNIEDSVVVDELVWQSMNALLSRNPTWVGVSMYSPAAGRFALRGYVETLEEAEELQDYINRNFDYLSRLENQVVIEKNLQAEVQSMLMEKGLTAVTFELSNGEVVFSGRVDGSDEKVLNRLIETFKKLPGVRVVKNFVVSAIGPSSRINLTPEYRVSGFSRRDGKETFIVINGRILGQGDLLDGMKITQVESKMVFLEKEGVKYRIDYNIQ